MGAAEGDGVETLHSSENSQGSKLGQLDRNTRTLEITDEPVSESFAIRDRNVKGVVDRNVKGVIMRRKILGSFY
jgi:hypothetical protein